MFGKLLANRGANAAGIERQPLPVARLELLHLARKDAPLKAIQSAVKPINLIEALVSYGGFELVQRDFSSAQSVAERLGQIDQLAEDRAQFRKHAGLLP